MPSPKSKFVCQKCGYEYPRWIGKCPDCGEWNSMVEEPDVIERSNIKIKKSSAKAKVLDSITPDIQHRHLTKINELDRVLGGGLMRGSIVLIGGDPGIGKSTLILQTLTKIEGKSLYVTGEESIEQIKIRADRLKIKNRNLFVASETNLNSILGLMEEEKPDVVVIDSIQTVFISELSGAPGTVGQIRECTAKLMQISKKNNVTVFIIGHVTKEGSIAGPKVLEHIVDTVVQFEGERNYSFRILRCIKNRFGSTNEIGIFEMQEDGLVEVSNPSEVFLSQRGLGISGTVVTSLIEGSRPILIEVQALLTHSNYGMPQRVSTGFDYRRLSILLAVIEKRINIKLSQFNALVNIAGGVTVNSPDADLAICSAIVSSVKDISIDPKLCVVGEIGLGGEVRSVHQLEKRISEAEKLGFERIIIPSLNNKKITTKNIQIIPVNNLKQALDQIFK